MGNVSLQALMGPSQYFLSITDGDVITLPQRLGCVTINASAASTGSSIIEVPGAEEGDLLRIEVGPGAGTLKLNQEGVSTSANVTENAILMGAASRTLTKGDSIILQRYKDTTTFPATSGWREVHFINIT